MVAYSFQRRFAEPIIAGTKCQTIRAARKRHARPGEPLQLYVGMRTKQCRKLLDRDPVCSEVLRVRLVFPHPTRDWRECLFFADDDSDHFHPDAMTAFARADGFVDVDDMRAFWFEHHGADLGAIDFRGVLIKWRPA